LIPYHLKQARADRAARGEFSDDDDDDNYEGGTSSLGVLSPSAFSMNDGDDDGYRDDYGGGRSRSLNKKRASTFTVTL